MAKNFVIFDGSNFYHGSKKLAPEVHLTNFNYRKLAELITQSTDNTVEYCVGEIKRQRGNPKSERMYAGQQALFYNLEQQGVEKLPPFFAFEIKKPPILDRGLFTIQILV